MISIDPHLAVRAGAIYLTAVPTLVLWVWRRPWPRARAGILLALVWNACALLALHVWAIRMGWWRFDASGGLLLGMPVDVYLAWTLLWGAIAPLAFRDLPFAGVVTAAAALDIVLMPVAEPVVHLGPRWLVGEAAALAIALVPSQLLYRWTARDEHLVGRAVLQVLAFSGVLLFVLPTIAIEGSRTDWANPFVRPLWQLSLIVQALAVPAIVGVSAVQEFVERGGGTPVPFDAPPRLVRTGIYAYVRNPMQLSAVLLLLALGLVLRNVWVASAGVIAHFYSVGLAAWDEDDDLARRFGDQWTRYHAAVRAWLPRWRPRFPDVDGPARLYVAASCHMCSQVGHWFADRRAANLTIIAAEQHPTRRLTRITYEHADGTVATGVTAIARALEHIHFGWAWVGAMLRLPVITQAVQLIADASGAEPRAVLRDVR